MKINEEYEKIFRIPKHPSLFDSVDEYDELRQSIMNAPQVEFISENLPFDGIEYTTKPIREKRKRISTRKKERVLSSIISALQRRFDSSSKF